MVIYCVMLCGKKKHTKWQAHMMTMSVCKTGPPSTSGISAYAKQYL